MRIILLGLLWVMGLASVGAWAAPNAKGEAAPATNSRFVISANGSEVYDKKTDLTWQRCSHGQRWKNGEGCVGMVKGVDWDTAKGLENGEWRLPSRRELVTLLAPGRYSGNWDHLSDDQKRAAINTYQSRADKNGVIDLAAFPDMQDDMLWYWSGETIAPWPAWYVSFGYGDVNLNDRSFTHAVRLVRGGQ